MQKKNYPIPALFHIDIFFCTGTEKTSTYLFSQFNTTLHDVTKGNNPWRIGLSLQIFLNNKTRFKPTIELTGDVYLADDKVYRTDSTGAPLNVVGGMVNIFIGTSFNPTRNIYLSVVVGPSFISRQILLGIKPSFGFYFFFFLRWVGKISYINIFNRGNIIKGDFSSLSLAIGCKLF